MIPLTEARNRLSEIVDDVTSTGSEVVISCHGRPVAVVIGYDEYESLIETLNILDDEATAIEGLVGVAVSARRVRLAGRMDTEQYECHAGGGWHPRPVRGDGRLVPIGLRSVIPAEAGIHCPAAPSCRCARRPGSVVCNGSAR